MNLRDKSEYLDTTNIRTGVVKVVLLKDAENSSWRCTYEGIVDGATACKNKAIYTVHSNYKKQDAEWVCQEHLPWAINNVKKFATNKKSVPRLKKEDFILDHDIHISYLWDNSGYECSFYKEKDNEKSGCFGNFAKYIVNLKGSKDKRNQFTVCNMHFKRGIKAILKNNRGR